MGSVLDYITAQAESGNRDYRPNGQPVMSPAGARFAMQVMPSTARDPGFGLKPANPNDPNDMNRLGREYRATMEKRYGGDPAKMWAAYNWGPGNLDSALARHGDNWLSAAPAETRKYVQNNLSQLGKQMPAPLPALGGKPKTLADLQQPPMPQDEPLSVTQQGSVAGQTQMPSIQMADVQAPKPGFFGQGGDGWKILGVIGDTYNAVNGAPTPFLSSMQDQRQQEAEDNRARERLTMQMEAQRQKHLYDAMNPKPTQTDRYIAAIMDPNTPPELKAIYRQVIMRPIGVPTYNADGSAGETKFFYPDQMPGMGGTSASDEDEWEYNN